MLGCTLERWKLAYVAGERDVGTLDLHTKEIDCCIVENAIQTSVGSLAGLAVAGVLDQLWFDLLEARS